MNGSLFQPHMGSLGEAGRGLTAIGGRNKILIADAALIDDDLRFAYDVAAGLYQRRQEFLGQRRDENRHGRRRQRAQINSGLGSKLPHQLLFEQFRRKSLLALVGIIDQRLVVLDHRTPGFQQFR